MTKDEAMKLALEALETLPAGASYKTHNAASALRQALEQPEQTVSLEEYKRLQRLVTSQGIRLMEYESKQEPVAWGCQYKSARLDVFKNKEVAEKYVSGSLRNGADVRLVELYTTPPKSEWVGLTDDELSAIWGEFGLALMPVRKAIASEIEAKLKEKNHD